MLKVFAVHFDIHCDVIYGSVSGIEIALSQQARRKILCGKETIARIR